MDFTLYKINYQIIKGWTEREKGKEGGEHSDKIYQMVQACFNPFHSDS